MEDNVNMLELLRCPAFCVRDGHITQVNREAARYCIAEGASIWDMLATGRAEYENFAGGRLCLTLQLEGIPFAADVLQQGDQHLFLLEQETIDAQLQSFALAAQELRGPLTGMMTAVDRLQHSEALRAESVRDMAQMNRRLHQMLRLVGNMSDAIRFAEGHSNAAYADIGALLDEIFQKAACLAEKCQKTLKFTGLCQQVFTLADSQLLERAVYNLISNAMKYSPQGSVIEAKLTKSGSFLRFSITDPGCGIAGGMQGNVFTCYRRQPGLEDPRQGLGLGLLLVRLAAMNHGGTVLIDQPPCGGTRVTMTIAIRQEAQSSVRCPMLRIDYAGERDHALVELSDVLDAALYDME